MNRSHCFLSLHHCILESELQTGCNGEYRRETIYMYLQNNINNNTTKPEFWMFLSLWIQFLLL